MALFSHARAFVTEKALKLTQLRQNWSNTPQHLNFTGEGRKKKKMRALNSLWLRATRLFRCVTQLGRRRSLWNLEEDESAHQLLVCEIKIVCTTDKQRGNAMSCGKTGGGGVPTQKAPTWGELTHRKVDFASYWMAGYKNRQIIAMFSLQFR